MSEGEVHEHNAKATDTFEQELMHIELISSYQYRREKYMAKTSLSQLSRLKQGVGSGTQKRFVAQMKSFNEAQQNSY
jgi:hypothetical protein